MVPVLDLKLKFGETKTEFEQDTAVIVAEIEREDSKVSIGILVDSANEVVTLEQDQIEPPPRMGVFIDHNYILGMGKMNDEFIVLLNIDTILSDQELSRINEL